MDIQFVLKRSSIDRTHIVTRYFYPADEERWLNLEARHMIGINQMELLAAYRYIKSSHPTMCGMTATIRNNEPQSYAPILPQ